MGASLIAGVMAFRQGWSAHQVIHAWTRGVKTLVLAVLILLLAWSIGAVCGDLGTDLYVLSATQSILDPGYVPLLKRAYELWDELELESRRKFFHRTGFR